MATARYTIKNVDEVHNYHNGTVQNITRGRNTTGDLKSARRVAAGFRNQGTGTDVTIYDEHEHKMIQHHRWVPTMDGDKHYWKNITQANDPAPAKADEIVKQNGSRTVTAKFTTMDEVYKACTRQIGALLDDTFKIDDRLAAAKREKQGAKIIKGLEQIQTVANAKFTAVCGVRDLLFTTIKN